MTNNYTGFTPQEGWQPERIRSDINKEEFFSRFIATRTPVIIGGFIPEISPNQWTLPYLKKHAGNAQVDVEIKTQASPNFGLGNKQKMKLKDFLTKLEDGDTTLYMTTQKIPDDDEIGLPESLFGQPLKQLEANFPPVPALLGNLIPNNINIWIGNAPTNATSGLHHDFHDNLYILLKGRKRFSIAAPSEAPNLYVNGTIKRIHTNGLINYRGFETLSDGSISDLVEELALSRVTQKSEDLKLQTADGNSSLIKKAQAQLEQAKLDQEHDLLALQNWMSEDDPTSDNEESESPDPSEAPPNHFSSLYTLENISAIDKKKYPNLFKATIIRFELNEGEMLFLPASWFHEVVSSGTNPPKGKQTSQSGIHVAFNYWMHPTQQPHFMAPYVSHFWANAAERYPLLRSHLKEVRLAEIQYQRKQKIEVKKRKNESQDSEQSRKKKI